MVAVIAASALRVITIGRIARIAVRKLDRFTVEAAGDSLVWFLVRFNGTVLPLEEDRVQSRLAQQPAQTLNVIDDGNREMIEEFPHRV